MLSLRCRQGGERWLLEKSMGSESRGGLNRKSAMRIRSRGHVVELCVSSCRYYKDVLDIHLRKRSPRQNACSTLKKSSGHVLVTVKDVPAKTCLWWMTL